MLIKQKLSLALVISIIISLLISIYISYKIESNALQQPSTIKGISTQVDSKTFEVIRVIDGDTLEIETKQKVRLIGIDTPERNDCFGIQAKEKLTELTLQKRVTLLKDISETDRYGRLLRYVYVGENFINKSLVEHGFALTATFPPDVKYKESFLKAQNDAMEHKRGLWKDCLIY